MNRFILLAASCGLCVVGLAAVPATGPAGSARASVPDASSQAAMQKLVHELYARQYGDSAAASRTKLANMLLDQAGRTHSDATARFVLLKEAADLACAANDADTAIRAIDLLAGDFDIEPFDLKIAALRRIVLAVSASNQARRAVEQCLDLAEEAMLRQHDAAAESLLGLAQNAANKSNQVNVALKVRQRQKEFTALRQEQGEFQAAQVRLRAGQASAADRLVIGKMLCFLIGDWKNGLGLLADGQDADLSKIAGMELRAVPGNAMVCMGVANAWWEVAQHQPRMQKKQVLRHAAQWYRQARPNLSGVNLDIAEARLAQVPLTTEDIASLKPGLTTDIYSGQNFEHFLVRRVDRQINFNWGSGPIGPTLPKDDFSLRWQGYLLTSSEGEYTFILLANSGGRLMIDGKMLIDSDKLGHKRKGAAVQQRLASGAHAFRAEAWDGGGTAKAIVQWIVPGETEATAIPPEALRRE